MSAHPSEGRTALQSLPPTWPARRGQPGNNEFSCRLPSVRARERDRKPGEPDDLRPRLWSAPARPSPSAAPGRAQPLCVEPPLRVGARQLGRLEMAEAPRTAAADEELHPARRTRLSPRSRPPAERAPRHQAPSSMSRRRLLEDHPLRVRARQRPREAARASRQSGCPDRRASAAVRTSRLVVRICSARPISATTSPQMGSSRESEVWASVPEDETDSSSCEDLWMTRPCFRP